MDILQQLEEVEKKLAESPEETNPEPETTVIEEPSAEPEVTTEPETTGEDVATEQPKPEVPVTEPETDEPEAPKTATEYAKERRQSKKELEQELINAKAQIAAMQAIQASKAEVKPEPVKQTAPDPREDPDAYRDWVVQEQHKAIQQTQGELAQLKRETLQVQAKAELASIESDFAKRAPDYTEVMADAEARMTALIRLQNPGANEAQIRSMIDADKLQGAIAAVKAGQNPAEAMYNRVKTLFRYEAAKATPQVKSEAEKLSAVAANKKKAASGISGTGTSGGSHLSKEALMKMTPMEYAKLSSEEKALFVQ